jgi:ribosomal protein L3
LWKVKNWNSQKQRVESHCLGVGQRQGGHVGQRCPISVRMNESCSSGLQKVTTVNNSVLEVLREQNFCLSGLW